MRSVFLWLSSIYFFPLISASKTVLKREPIVYKDGLPIGNIQVGTPAQNFSVLYDTSNSLIWVPSTKCRTNVCRQHSQIYNAASSSTAVNLHEKASIKYEEGVCVDAALYTDTVSVAGTSVRNQIIGSAYSVKGLGGDGYLGSFGLGGYNEDGSIQYVTSKNTALSKRQRVGGGGYVPNAYQSGYGVSSMAFSMNIPHSNGFYQKRSNEVVGEFIFGIDHDLYEGCIAYLSLSTCDFGDSPYWKSELNYVKLGKDIDLKIENKTLASFSTDSSYIHIPPEQAKLLHTALDGYYDEKEGYYRLNCCDKIDELPDLNFDFTGYRVSLPPKVYVKKQSDTECHTLIVHNNKDSKNWILGGSFLNNFYQIYDLENKQIGLAIPKGSKNVKIDELH